jgi:GTPase-associated protein 1, N-terminal domain type 1/Effector-associated domain 1
MVNGADTMTIFFDWAIFGEIDRRHGLIDSSMKSEQREHLNMLATLSDRPSSDPPPGTMQVSYLSGFPYGKDYVLMRTFPDLGASRGGMVRSFCFILPMQEIEVINDLSTVIKLLPPINSTSSEWITWKGNNLYKTFAERKPTEIVNLSTLPTRLGFIDSLLRNDLPGIWSESQDDFEDIIVELWASLPPNFRRILRFGRSYSRKDLGDPKSHFLTTPKNAAARWQAEVIIKPLDREPNSRAELLLLGNIADNPLAQFISLLPDISEFRNLKLADDCLKAFEDTDQGDISQAVAVAAFLNVLAPGLHQAGVLKERSLLALEGILKNADISSIRYFANLSLNAFTNAEKRLGKLITELVNCNLRTNKYIDPLLVEWTFNEMAAPWWRSAVSIAIFEQTKNLTSSFASILWEWWLNMPELVLPLVQYLPSNADLLLYESVPPKMDKKNAFSILERISQKFDPKSNIFPRLWTFLKVISKVPNDQVLQECLNRSNGIDIALNIFRKHIGEGTFLDIAIAVTDEKVLKEAGDCCFENVSLLSYIAPESIAWRKIWLFAIERGLEPLTGIPYPSKAMGTLLDELLLGNAVDSNLLIYLSRTTVANLIDYDSRTKIWSLLPSEARIDFLEATTQGVFDRWREDSNLQPEAELVQIILKSGYLSAAIKKSELNLSCLIRNYMAFIVSRNGYSSNAKEVIKVFYEKILIIPDVEIRSFASWLRQKKWVDIAEIAFQYYQDKPHSHVLSVLVECTLEILPMFTRLNAIISLKRPTAYTDFYISLREVLTNIFTKGPSVDGFWEDVGGKPGDLRLQGTVAEAWYSAILAVQQGKVSLERVIYLARERYPNNSDLETLEHLSHKLKDC